MTKSQIQKFLDERPAIGKSAFCREVDMTRGEKIYNWIKDAHSKGFTVYATTYLKSIKIEPKNIHMVRVNNGHCEIQMGKRWDSINYCKIEAKK